MEIKGNNALINIEILGKSNPSATNEWDKKWLMVKIKIKLIGFNADFRTEILIDDFLEFLKSIENALNRNDNEFEFKTMEESIYLKGTINHLGSIEWNGFVVHPVGNGNKLIFKFESEHYQLEKIKDELGIQLYQ
jgi:hypothetical protein